MTDYTTRDQRIILTQQELDALKAMLDGGDRGGFYMTYNAMTDSAEAMLQAKVATFSGLAGGAAFVSNRFLQDEYGVDGSETPGRYDGIYYLSQLVAQSAYDAIKESAEAGGDGTGKISDQRVARLERSESRGPVQPATAAPDCKRNPGYALAAAGVIGPC